MVPCCGWQQDWKGYPGGGGHLPHDVEHTFQSLFIFYVSTKEFSPQKEKPLWMLLHVQANLCVCDVLYIFYSLHIFKSLQLLWICCWKTRSSWRAWVIQLVNLWFFFHFFNHDLRKSCHAQRWVFFLLCIVSSCLRNNTTGHWFHLSILDKPLKTLPLDF